MLLPLSLLFQWLLLVGGCCPAGAVVEGVVVVVVSRLLNVRSGLPDAG